MRFEPCFGPNEPMRGVAYNVSMIRFGASVSAVLLTCAACTPKDAEREAPKSVSQASVKSATRRGPPEMLLAKWVCVGDNGSGMNGSTFEFRKDGSVKLHTSNGETITTKFKTETGRDWISRRLSDPKQSEDPAYSMWTKDGI